MGKRIISRARGKGGPPYRSPGHRYAGQISYPQKPLEGIVIDIIHDAGRDSPLAKVRFGSGANKLVVAAEGIRVGQKINFIAGAPATGNVLPLSAIPKGSYIFGIENTPMGGPKLCLTAGTHAMIVGHETAKTIVQMPSKEFKNFNPLCLATVGIPAGGGRGDKPYIRAGQVHYAKHARNKLWPRSSATKMNPVDHPFGGKTKPGWPKTMSRWAPPGQKVGSIAASRGGKKKK
ncbi:MAG TPA: 50S ribosomal protein L2 [archaeon]|nr:50S ribosomal protein L2 [archaeon]